MMGPVKQPSQSWSLGQNSRECEAGVYPKPEPQEGSTDCVLIARQPRRDAPIEKFPRENWDMIIAINLSAAFHAIAAAIPGIDAPGSAVQYGHAPIQNQ
jgi:NAD(P)-dependent dehydrogenase (short-subunit alcohol dehydrogenase family)